MASQPSLSAASESTRCVVCTVCAAWSRRQAEVRDDGASATGEAVYGHTAAVHAQGCGDAPNLALSQMTENRKVEAHKSLIFRNTILRFGLKKAKVRQSQREYHDALLLKPSAAWHP